MPETIPVQTDLTDDQMALVQENMALAHFMANRTMDLDPHQALSVAMGGLIRGVQTFDPTRVCSTGKLATLGGHMARCIRWALSRERMKLRSVTRGGWQIFVSLDESMGDDRTLLGSTPDDTAVNPADELSTRDLHAMIRGLLPELTDRQRFVIERRFGLNGHRAMLGEEVGQLLGVTHQRVQQIEKEAVTLLGRRLPKEV